MVKFVIVRHGFSQGNREKRFSGQLDVPLDDAGLKQAESIAKYISENLKIDSIYSSDLCRAYDTAKPCAQALGLEINVCEALRETDVGAFTGMLIEDAKAKYPEEFENYRINPGITTFPEGESYGDVLSRVLRALEKIAAENDGKAVLIATHGGVVRVLRAHWLNVSFENIGVVPHVPNASITIAEYHSADNVVLTQIGYTDHLDIKTTEVGVH